MSEKRVVTAITRAPLKSGGLIETTDPDERIRVEAHGLEHDRTLCVAAPIRRDGGYEVLTARKYHQMVLISPGIGEAALRLTAPEVGSVEIPFEFEADDTKLITARMPGAKGAEMTGQEADSEISEWVSDYLHVEAKLLRFRRDIERLVKPYYSRSFTTNRLAFQDGSAISLGTEASYAMINRQIVEDGHNHVSSQRFRANIKVAGGNPSDEFYWSWIAIGKPGVDLVAVAASARCVETEVDPSTGRKLGNVVLPALGQVRKGVRRDGETGTFADLNLNIPKFVVGKSLSVGDEVAVIIGSTVPNVEIKQ